MTTPVATARLQLNAAFTLDDACNCVDYYHQLGVSHLYLSPVTQAMPASTHGYDVIDHAKVSQELGAAPALRRLAAATRQRGMGLILDIVPNHMAAHPENAWWRDVLKFGQASRYAHTFDIDWAPIEPSLRRKVLLPVLPDAYGNCLANGLITLVRSELDTTYSIDVAGLRYPLTDSEPAPGGNVQHTLMAYSAGSPDGQARLHALLERQHYRLAWWRTASDQINWRRFFEISNLVGVRVENPSVFDAVHQLVLRLFGEGIIDGVRVDHVDGLAAPGAYCRKLRSALLAAGTKRSELGLDSDPYVIVEKILAGDEPLDGRWQVDGTTGYDFMDQVSALLHEERGHPALQALWSALTNDHRSPQGQLLDVRYRMLTRHFPVERVTLVRALSRVASLQLVTRDWSPVAIDRVLTAWLAAFPAYRTYAEDGGRTAVDQAHCRCAVTHAAHALNAAEGDAEMALLDQLDLWLNGVSTRQDCPAMNAARDEALRRCQQLTPPLAAKALEDTLHYRYGPLLSRNEVGSHPERFALSREEFLALSKQRGRSFPAALLTTATHDHKRGEDVRARLAVVSEIVPQWADTVMHWLAKIPTGVISPNMADRYFLLQTLVGTWPLTLSVNDTSGMQAFFERIAAWQLKAIREAKLHTSWTEPDSNYEMACTHFLQSIHTAHDGALLLEIQAYAHALAPAGMVNSLAQTLLRMTLPGVPDLYQGTELWDFSLVDPDNRRAVDYPLRAALLSDTQKLSWLDTRGSAWSAGTVKQALIRHVLHLRRKHYTLFTQGDCVAVPVVGRRAEQVVAFTRTFQGKELLIVVPRGCAWHLRGYANDRVHTALPYWDDTYLHVSSTQDNASPLQDTLFGRTLCANEKSAGLPISEALARFPVALFLREPAK